MAELRDLERCNACITGKDRQAYVKKTKERYGKEFKEGWRFAASDSFNTQIYLNKRKTRLVIVINLVTFRVFQVNHRLNTLDYLEVNKTPGKPPHRKWYLAYHHSEDEYRLVELKKGNLEPMKRYDSEICDKGPCDNKQ